MQTLLIIAIAMAAGLALSRLMKILNLPNVTGYLIAGVLIGPYVFNLVTVESIKSLKIITTTALGFIAFSIGGEFKLNFLKKLGAKIIIITVAQAAVTVLFGGVHITLFMNLPWLSTAISILTPWKRTMEPSP